MTIPNIISVIRIILVAAFCITFFTSGMREVSFWIIITSGLSDLLDGYIARKFNQVSELGKVLDPIADKLFHLSTILCFYIDGIINLWIVMAFLTKELFMLVGSTVLYKKTCSVIPSKWYGKLASSLFFVSFLAAFFFEKNNIIITLLFVFALAVSIFSAVNYTLTAVRINQEVKARKSIEGKE